MKKRFAFLLAMTFLVMTLLVINYKKRMYLLMQIGYLWLRSM